MTDLVQLAVTKDTTPKMWPEFSSGDTIGVSVKVKEGEKERVQLFKGVVLKVQGSGAGRSFTVRKISEGIGVERTFPMNSPSIDGIKIYSFGKRVRKSRMLYLRDRQGRAAKVKSELASATGERPLSAAAAAEAKAAKAADKAAKGKKAKAKAETPAETPEKKTDA